MSAGSIIRYLNTSFGDSGVYVWWLQSSTLVATVYLLWYRPLLMRIEQLLKCKNQSTEIWVQVYGCFCYLMWAILISSAGEENPIVFYSKFLEAEVGARIPWLARGQHYIYDITLKWWASFLPPGQKTSFPYSPCYTRRYCPRGLDTQMLQPQNCDPGTFECSRPYNPPLL